MSDITEQQVQATLRAVLQASNRATYDGSETQSYLHVPYRAQDAALLARILPKLIKPSDDLTIDPKALMLHLRFTTPEGYDSQPQTPTPTAEQLQQRMRELASDPKKYERALQDAMRDDGAEDAPTPYGQRAAAEFFRLVEQNANDPGALTSAINAGQSEAAKLEACLDQYYNTRPATDTIREAVAAEDMCRVKSREGAQR